ncbi:hypothetical protein AB4039_27510 [Streptomyces sp. M-16]|uniref:hypothetical protein n=1 Tax=Streptomyces sp. M-16 TaxID=3233040 RepID=UPI003F9D2C83
MDPTFAREGSLGGLVEIDAASEAGSQALSEVSIADFMPRHRRELDQILDAVKEIGNSTTTAMEITEALGWFNVHEITSASLLMWSGGIEDYSTGLDHPAIPPSRATCSAWGSTCNSYNCCTPWCALARGMAPQSKRPPGELRRGHTGGQPGGETTTLIPPRQSSACGESSSFPIS